MPAGRRCRAAADEGPRREETALLIKASRCGTTPGFRIIEHPGIKSTPE